MITSREIAAMLCNGLTPGQLRKLEELLLGQGPDNQFVRNDLCLHLQEECHKRLKPVWMEVAPGVVVRHDPRDPVTAGDGNRHDPKGHPGSTRACVVKPVDDETTEVDLNSTDRPLFPGIHDVEKRAVPEMQNEFNQGYDLDDEEG